MNLLFLQSNTIPIKQLIPNSINVSTLTLSSVTIAQMNKIKGDKKLYFL